MHSVPSYRRMHKVPSLVTHLSKWADRPGTATNPWNWDIWKFWSQEASICTFQWQAGASQCNFWKTEQMKEGVFNPSVLAQLLCCGFDFCHNTLMAIRRQTAPGSHVQNSNRDRHCFIAINSDAWERWQQAEKINWKFNLQIKILRP